MCTDANFLQKPIDQYKKNERLIIERFETECDIEIVANSLRELLKKIEGYKKQKDAILFQQGI